MNRKLLIAAIGIVLLAILVIAVQLGIFAPTKPAQQEVTAPEQQPVAQVVKDAHYYDIKCGVPVVSNGYVVGIGASPKCLSLRVTRWVTDGSGILLKRYASETIRPYSPHDGYDITRIGGFGDVLTLGRIMKGIPSIYPLKDGALVIVYEYSMSNHEGTIIDTVIIDDQTLGWQHYPNARIEVSNERSDSVAGIHLKCAGKIGDPQDDYNTIEQVLSKMKTCP